MTRSATRPWIIPLALFGWSALAFLWRLTLMLSSTHPLGTDGYFYVVQIEDLLALGHLHVADTSWVYPWLAAWNLLLPNTVLAVKVGSAALAAICVPAAWFAGRGLGRWLDMRLPNLPGEQGAAWTLAAWAAASPTLTHLAVDFPKNLAALPFLLLATGTVFHPDLRPRFRWPLLAFSLVMAAGAHRLGAALILLAAAGATLTWLLSPKSRRIKLGFLVLLFVGSALFFTASWLLPGLLHFADLERLNGVFAAPTGTWPPWCWFALRPTHGLQAFELMLAWGALTLAAFSFAFRPASRPVLLILGLPLLVCVAPIWKREVLDLGFRLSLMAPLLSIPLLLAALPPIRLPRPACLRPALLAVAVAASGLSLTGADPNQAPPYARYEKLIEAIPRPLPALLIAHQGINFLYDHQSGAEAMAWAPEPELSRADIGRLAWGIRDGEWLELLPEGPYPAPKRLDQDYVYLREDAWEAFLASAKKTANEDLSERIHNIKNPSRLRPAWMMRNRGKSISEAP
ncbi:MAG: hypothetical protein JRF33_00640 [Deltaproteobacteria bacterium]|nr:hypothetical protein [Deltaproteobacteria bacterium]